MDNQKSELANKDESAAKKQKVIVLEVKLELNINEVKEIANRGNFVTAVFLEILEMRSKEFSEGDIIYINVVMKSCCDERDEDVPETVMPVKTYPVRELLEIFHDIENAKEKILNADPAL